MAASDDEPGATAAASSDARSGVGALVVGFGILSSRVVGLVRERVLATYFGTRSFRYLRRWPLTRFTRFRTC